MMEHQTFEYQDHNKAHNYGWGALNFDLGKNEVQSFLISSIKFWIDFYHLDGIRVDAVSNMLYLTTMMLHGHLIKMVAISTMKDIISFNAWMMSLN